MTLRWTIIAIYCLIGFGLTYFGVLTGWPAYLAIIIIGALFLGTLLNWRR